MFFFLIYCFGGVGGSGIQNRKRKVSSRHYLSQPAGLPETDFFLLWPGCPQTPTKSSPA